MHVGPEPRPSVGPAAAVLAGVGPLVGTETNLQLTEPLLWAMIAISTAGAIVTFAFLVYALWKFRDPAVRRRRYG
ncbi:MAG TPA: hypothetical protein VML53_04815 [Thermoplasmata archaeon]|nr:hypothetical protein [Thermoplasmata archaeon]